MILQCPVTLQPNGAGRLECGLQAVSCPSDTGLSPHSQHSQHCWRAAPAPLHSAEVLPISVLPGFLWVPTRGCVRRSGGPVPQTPRDLSLWRRRQRPEKTEGTTALGESSPKYPRESPRFPRILWLPCRRWGARVGSHRSPILLSGKPIIAHAAFARKAINPGGLGAKPPSLPPRAG